MGTSAAARLTYREFEALPDHPDGRRVELIDGEVVVSPAPVPRHARVLGQLTVELVLWTREHGGQVLPGAGLLVAEDSEPIPDLTVVLATHDDYVGPKRVEPRADVVVEISSPSTRRIDLGRKRELYEAAGVTEYWFVDLDGDEVLVHRLDGPAYGEPITVTRDGTLVSPLLPGFALAVDRLL